MSSRALRKAQREREEQEALQKLQAEQEEEEDEEDQVIQARPQKSAFEMLNEQADEVDDEDEEVADPDTSAAENQPPSDSDSKEESQPKSAPQRRNKKKKKKAKGNAKPAQQPTASAKGSDLDDIDLALKSLSTNAATSSSGTAPALDPIVTEACRLLSIDTQHLHAQNEMRRLFGRAALEAGDEDDQGGGGRRRGGRGQQQAGIAAAVGRRQVAGGGRGAGLGQLGLRRNIFIQGKEEWPVGTSGGLGMEIVEKRADGTIEYRFVHNTGYQDVQSQFEACVASMDPQRMIQLLQFNPYHISTLLQVSEIAKQERDHTTSGDLLERALFSFGRAVHSTFSSNLSQGKARLDFRRPENREFWLAADRYIGNLSMRATWRTVFEWAKLLLSLDPEGDHYRMSLAIDQYALRARQPQQLVDLSSSDFFLGRWKQLPNIQISRGLAMVQAGQASRGKQALFTAVSRYPWAVSKLFQELGLDAPPAVWGKSARTDWEILHSDLYATRAKDIWITPEASNLLVEVSSAVSSDMPEPALLDKDIGPDEGRHILLTDKPELIALLPRKITSQVSSSSDPLPPADNLPSYTTKSISLRGSERSTSRLGSPAENLVELRGLYRFFAELFPWFNPQEGGAETAERPPEMTEDEIEQRIEQSGVSEEVIVQRTQRMMELQQSIVAGLDEEETRRLAEHGEADEEERE